MFYLFEYLHEYLSKHDKVLEGGINYRYFRCRGTYESVGGVKVIKYSIHQ